MTCLSFLQRIQTDLLVKNIQRHKLLFAQLHFLFLNPCISNLVQLSQISSAYSEIGLIKDVYI